MRSSSTSSDSSSSKHCSWSSSRWFTSIALAIGSIADTRTMGRISAKTLFWFLLCSFMALALAGCVGYATYSMGLFNAHIEGLTEAAGSNGSNPLNVVLNVIPSNIVTAFGSNNAVLSSVFRGGCGPEHECAG